MSEWIYSPGKKLTEYPRPSLAVDIAAFTYSREVAQLMLLLIDGPDGYRLPGAFVQENEPLRQTIERCMLEKAGVKGARATLLDIFDEPGRDPRGWVITAAHVQVIPETEAQRYDRSRAKWFPVHAIPDLQGDHSDIVDAALEKLRVEYEIDQTLLKGKPMAFSSKTPRNVYAGRPDPEGFFSRPFTLRELQTLHETVAGRVFLSSSLSVTTNYSSPRSSDFSSDSMMMSAPGSSRPSRPSRPNSTLRDTFRRLMEPQLDEVGTNEGTIGSRGAPSRTWLRRD